MDETKLAGAVVPISEIEDLVGGFDALFDTIQKLGRY